MAEERQTHILISTLQRSDRDNQKLKLQEIAACIQHASLKDIQELLLFINSTSDVELILKLFGIFTMAIMSAKNEIKNTIITNKSLYSKIHNILDRGLPYKSSIVLNLLTALVCTDHNELSHNSITEFAKNMTRLSGCLKALQQYFINNIMHPDTWQALCQCISECCKDDEINQEYCSHLIPHCIEKVQHGDNEVLFILYSLLNGNKSNCEKYASCGGCQIFTRDSLNNILYLEVLGALVDSAPHVVSYLLDTEIPVVLREQLHEHGPRSQIGQWCNVILYYFDVNNTEHLIKRTETISNLKEKKIEDEAMDTTGNTTLLYQNVMKEIAIWNTNGQMKLTTKLNDTKPFKLNINGCHNQTMRSKNKNNKTFLIDANDSFIINKQFRIRSENVTQKTLSEYKTHNTTYANKGCQTMHEIEQQSRCQTEQSFFEPPLHSTPKRNKKRERTIILNTDTYRSKLKDDHKNLTKNKPMRTIQHSTQMTSYSNDSMPTKLFRAINESCSSIIKSFKSMLPDTKFDCPQFIFKKPAIPKNSNNSFTMYMKKRDSILESKKFRSIDKDGSNFCETCNDTDNLKNKLRSNEHLRKSVEKLKLGINMYGCNFKKLSKILWPNEPYMTPNVLYSLYRKLILK